MLIQRGEIITFIILPDRRIDAVGLAECVRRVHGRDGDQVDAGIPHRDQRFLVLFQKLPVRKAVEHEGFGNSVHFSILMLFCGEFKKEMYAVVAGVGIFHPGHPGFGLLIFAFFSYSMKIILLVLF